MTKVLGWAGIFAGHTEIQKLLHTEAKKMWWGKNPAEILPFKETKIRRLSSLSNQSTENNEEGVYGKLV